MRFAIGLALLAILTVVVVVPITVYLGNRKRVQRRGASKRSGIDVPLAPKD